MATPDEVLKALMVVMPLFANYRPPQTAKDIDILKAAWHGQVGHLDADLLLVAMRDAAAKTEFFPTPKLVLECAAGIVMPESVSGEEAWGMVLRDVRRGVGYPYMGDEHPDYPHPRTSITDPHILAAVQAVGGWRLLQASTNDEDIAHRARFVAAYKASLERGRDRVKELPAVTSARQLAAGSRAGQMAALTAGIGRTKGERG